MSVFHKCSDTRYDREELANTITHFTAFLAAVVGTIFLLLRATKMGTTLTVVACSIYGACMLITFLTSAIYHSSHAPKLRRIFHILDHMVIYFMIAGTYTPFTLVTLQGTWGWSLLVIIWGLAIIGLIFKMFFTGRFNLLSTGIYVMMGWMAVIAIVPIVEALSVGGLFWLVLGGAMYTLGVIFYLMETVPFAHTVWHMFVIAGALAHFICIYQYVAIK